jgi:hypothetical protein
MASPSEIEKLERRYAENPEGRFFAPLADAYRKAGQVDRALELVHSGLERHPDYLSAHIVLGRCLLDKGDDAEADKTFQAVLGLDAENIIALKSLAEISERAGKVVEARQWLQKLLVVDSMNVEAEADLQRLGGPVGAETTQPVEGLTVEAGPEVSFADVASEIERKSKTVLRPELAPEIEPPTPKPEPPSFAESPTQPMPAMPLELPPEPLIEPVAEVEEPAEETPQPPVQAAAAGLDLMPFDDSLAWGTGERSSRVVHMEDIAAVVHDDAVTSPAIEFVASIGSEPAEPAPPAEEPSSLAFSIEPPPDQDFAGVTEGASEAAPDNVELPANLSGMYSIVDEVPPAAAPEAPSPTSDLPLILPEDVTPADELARPSSKLVQIVSPAPPREEPAAVAEPMLTETMGDLYLRQGFRSEAADVYRRLLSQRPGDEGLAAKLHALEAPPPNLSAAALGAESVGAWLRRVAHSRLSAPAASAPPPPEHSVEPSPLEAAFSAPSPQAIGEPAHPAREAFSLDQIYGSPDGSSGPSAASPSAPPAAPATGASFDEFFGQPPEQGSVRPVAQAPDQPAQAGEEDLTAFNSWLQGLKK